MKPIASFALALALALVAVIGCKEKSENKSAATPAKTAAVKSKETVEPKEPTGPSVTTKEVIYNVGDQEFRGYLATDSSATGKRPGVLVVHEWWGHNDYARKRARMLAEMGYTALAVDMYGDGKQASHPKDAMAFSSAVMKNKETAQARFVAAMEELKKHASTDADKIAAIGYCFGGAVVLEMAKRGVDLDLVASFHGSLSADTPIAKGDVKSKLFVAHGADDPFVKPEALADFRKQMSDADVDMVFTAYEGASHSFTNPDADANGKKFKLPLAYNADADKKSWATLSEMLTTAFK